MTTSTLPGLDLRPLQIGEAAFSLRAWAVINLRSLLKLETHGNAAQHLLQLKVRPWRWPSRLADRLEEGTLRPFKLREDTRRLRHPISLLIMRYLRTPRSGWLAWLPRRGFETGLVETFWPPSLWSVIETLAWHEPRFQKEIGVAVCEHFRRIRPLPGGFLPAPTFRPQVWWLLLDLVGVPELGQPPRTGLYPLLRRTLGKTLGEALWRWWHRRSRLGRYRHRLSEIARTQLLTADGWAGFWEQWLVGEVLLQRPGPVAYAAPGSRQMLDLLPLLARPRYRKVKNDFALAASDTVRRDRGGLVDPGWEEQVPEWLAVDMAGDPARRRASRRIHGIRERQPQ